MYRCSMALVMVCLVGGLRAAAAADEETTTIRIGELNQAYVSAFNAQDADEVAACFRNAGDYTLLTGDTVSGRRSIRAAHESFFENNPNAKVTGEQVHYRQVLPGVVLASGVWEVSDGPAVYPSKGLWFTVIVKRDDQWRYEAMRLVIPAEPE